MFDLQNSASVQPRTVFEDNPVYRRRRERATSCVPRASRSRRGAVSRVASAFPHVSAERELQSLWRCTSSSWSSPLQLKEAIRRHIFYSHYSFRTPPVPSAFEDSPLNQPASQPRTSTPKFVPSLFHPMIPPTGFLILNPASSRALQAARLRAGVASPEVPRARWLRPVGNSGGGSLNIGK